MKITFPASLGGKTGHMDSPMDSVEEVCAIPTSPTFQGRLLPLPFLFFLVLPARKGCNNFEAPILGPEEQPHQPEASE